MSKKVFLKPKREKPFFFYHPWVFSGAVAFVDDDIKTGDFVNVFSSKGEFIGSGFFNEKSNITVRLFSFTSNNISVEKLIIKRIQDAINTRKTVYIKNHTNACRLINAEGDFLPGLICDIYDKVLVVQLNSAGFIHRSEYLIEEIKNACKVYLNVDCSFIIDKTPEKVFLLEGINRTKIVQNNECLKDIAILENGNVFNVDLIEGQKTGFYTDQRENRLLSANTISGLTGLDCFSYTGGFAIYLSKKNNVQAIETSAKSCKIMEDNLKINRCKAEIVCDDVYKILEKTNKVDFINIDPPKYISGDKDYYRGIKQYELLFTLCLLKIKEGGFLGASSCSSILTPDDFLQVLSSSAVKAKRLIKILAFNGAGSDYPVSLHCPESRYLKFALLKVE